MKRNSLNLFFGLAFLFPWLIWGTTIAENYGYISFHIPQPLAFWIGLTLATYLTAALEGGFQAIKDLLIRITSWRSKPIWYFISLSLTGLVSLVSIGIFLSIGGKHHVGGVLTVGKLLPALLFQTFLFLVTEETAWRGFALPRLQEKFSATSSSLILGGLWGLWHLPLIFIPRSFQSSIPFFGFVLSAMAMSILLTWVFNHTKGSVLLAAIFHAATDVTIAFTNVMSGDRRLFWIFIAVQWAVSLAVILLEGTENLSRVKVGKGSPIFAKKSI
jgi:membrane protease YdiL (CAAX protease family)